MAIACTWTSERNERRGDQYGQNDQHDHHTKEHLDAVRSTLYEADDGGLILFHNCLAFHAYFCSEVGPTIKAGTQQNAYAIT